MIDQCRLRSLQRGLRGDLPRGFSFFACIVALLGCASQTQRNRSSPEPPPFGTSVKTVGDIRRLAVQARTDWGRDSQPVVVPLEVTSDHVFVNVRAWADALRQPTDLRVAIDSGARFGVSLSQRTARRLQPWMAPESLGLNGRVWTVFGSFSAQEGALRALELGVWRQEPVHLIVRDAKASPGLDVIGFLWMREAAGMCFDWSMSRLTVYPVMTEGVPPSLRGPDSQTRLGHWIQAALAQQTTRVFSPPFEEKADAIRWLTEMDDPDPARTLAEFPDHSDRPFKAYVDAVVADSLPCVPIELAGQHRIAVVDLGHSGDIGWFGAPPPEEVFIPGSMRRITVRASDGSGRVDRRRLSVPVRLAGMELTDLTLDLVSNGSPDTNRLGFGATLGLGVLRRFPVIFDFKRDCLWLWISDE
jgi:hypothetical protein